jgi:hypothetical protein
MRKLAAIVGVVCLICAQISKAEPTTKAPPTVNYAPGNWSLILIVLATPPGSSQAQASVTVVGTFQNKSKTEQTAEGNCLWAAQHPDLQNVSGISTYFFCVESGNQNQ